MIELVCPLAGVVLGIVRSVLVRRYAVNVGGYDMAAGRLIAAGNLDRLSKLNRAARPYVYPAAIEAALQSVLAGAPDYPAALAQAGAREAFARAHEAELQRFRKSPFVDWIQLALGPGIAAWALWHGQASPWVLVAGAAALFLLVDAQVKRARIRRANVTHAAPLLDQIVAARGKQGTDPYRTATPDPPAGAARYLQITRNGVQLSSFALTQPIVKIGRAKASHVVLDDDSVSRMHAVLEDADGMLTLIDLGNTTLVNGVRVSKQVLAPGDRIGIGPFEIVVVDSPGVDVAPPALLADPDRACSACGSFGFSPLGDAPEGVVPAGYRGEHCRSCGKVELFKVLG